MRRLRRILLSKAFWLLVGVAVIGVVMNEWMDEEGGPRVVVERWGVWAWLASLVIKTALVMTPVGAVLLSIVNGILFPFWLAVGINLLSGIIGGVGMYYVWRRADHEFDIQSNLQRLPRWFQRHAADNLWFLTVLRLLPWAGGNLADLMAGAHRIPMRTHVLSMILGYAPGAIGYAVIGAGLVPWS